MASFVWKRDPQEANDNPYEYPAQEQYVREATAALAWLTGRVNPRELRFEVNDTTPEKALWMLRADTLDTLSEALQLITEKRHRPAGRLFRDALETADLAYVIAADPAYGAQLLVKWYENEPIPHGKLRAWMKKRSPALEQDRRKHYTELARFTHRTYRSLLKSYSVGGGNRLVHDGSSKLGTLVLPHTLAAYYCIHAELLLIFVKQLCAVGVLTPEDEAALWKSALEEQGVPRCAVRFGPVVDAFQS